VNGLCSRLVGTLQAGVVLTISAFGQSLVEPERIPSVRQFFEVASSAPQLRCEISPIRPSLNFGFRFEAGYTVTIPLAQLRGSGHGLNMHVQVTPSGREPVYLVQTGVLPEVPETKADGVTGGAFIVGEGTYDVAILVEDDLHRSCRRVADSGPANGERTTIGTSHGRRSSGRTSGE